MNEEIKYCLFCQKKLFNTEKYCSRSCSNKYRWKFENFKEKIITKERNEKISKSNFGKKRSEETKLSISNSLVGKKKSDEHRKNVSIAIKEKFKNDAGYRAKQITAAQIRSQKKLGVFTGPNKNISIGVKESYNKHPELRKLRSLQLAEQMKRNNFVSKRGIHGNYISKNGNKEYFHSLLELGRMIQLDDADLLWTKNHKIVIDLQNGHNYFPDFLIEDNIVEEVKKEYELSNKDVIRKAYCATNWCAQNGYFYRFCTEREINKFYNLAKKLSSFKTRLIAGNSLEIEELMTRVEILRVNSFKNTSILDNQQLSPDEGKVQRPSKDITNSNESSRVGSNSETPSTII